MFIYTTLYRQCIVSLTNPGLKWVLYLNNFTTVLILMKWLSLLEIQLLEEQCSSGFFWWLIYQPRMHKFVSIIYQVILVIFLHTPDHATAYIPSGRKLEPPTTHTHTFCQSFNYRLWCSQQCAEWWNMKCKKKKKSKTIKRHI